MFTLDRSLNKDLARRFFLIFILGFLIFSYPSNKVNSKFLSMIGTQKQTEWRVTLKKNSFYEVILNTDACICGK